jgi:tight adherence protein C
VQHYELVMSILVGGTVASLAWILLSMLTAPREVSVLLGRFEQTRRDQLRDVNAVYRYLEPWIDEIVGIVDGQCPRVTRQLGHDLPAAASGIPWQPAEFLATKIIESVLVAVGTLLLTISFWEFSTSLMYAVGFAGLYLLLAVSGVKSKAARRRGTIRRRFTSSFDLVSLMMDVGANFHEAVTAVAKDLGNHPLGEELDRLLQDTEMGRLRGESMRAFSQRIADSDIDELINGVVTAEELGTPIAETIKTQTEQMRQKRIQWAEKASEESKVKLVFPAMLIMVACLLIMAAPFILDAVLQK